MRKTLQSCHVIFRRHFARTVPKDGLTLADFAGSPHQKIEIDPQPWSAEPRKFYIETYGCQMNVSDSEVIHRVLQQSGIQQTKDLDEADVILVNTCAIRDNAERKVWERLNIFRSIKRDKQKNKLRPPLVGVLGCMAERLKETLLESDKMVDVVAGPDAYRSLPNLLDEAAGGKHAMNTMLSLHETYEDLPPIRRVGDVSAYLSIMRGCEQYCAYCVVPFTRGKERSRTIESVVEEVKQLSADGVKEVILLGQNVNSYNDLSKLAQDGERIPFETTMDAPTPGFRNIARKKVEGVGFTELLRRVSEVDPNMRIRFTSPHPKDFPESLLTLIRDTPNICKQIHLPVQSGSSAVLERMRRGYTREAYLALADRVKSIIPNVALSTDIITGFCGETQEDHEQSVALMKQLAYEQAYMYKYSQREKTFAHRKYADDIPEEVKGARLLDIIAAFREGSVRKNEEEIGRTHLVLVEGFSKRSQEQLSGRTDNNKSAVFDKKAIRHLLEDVSREPKPGDYVKVKVVSSTQATLRCEPLYISNIEMDAKDFC